jgi:hypothetical protein
MSRVRDASLALVGLFGSCVALTKPIIWIIDRLSEIDFLATYGGEFGRFLDTGFGTLASAVVGCAIIGFSIFKGLQAPATVGNNRFSVPAPSVNATKKEVPAPSYEWGLLDEPIITPRMDTIIAGQVTTAAELYEKAEGQEVMVVHYLSGLDDKTRRAAENLCATLRSLMTANGEQKEPLYPWERDEFCEKISQQMVLLKGDDILIYADTHFKWLPERDNIPVQPDPWMAEFRMIIAFRRREENEDNFSVEVAVDHGQPRLHREGLKPRTGARRLFGTSARGHAGEG